MDLALITNFSQAMRQSDHQATRLGHNYIGTEHFLLSLLAEQQGTVATLLADLGLDRAAVSRRIEDYVATPGQSAPPAGIKAQTPRAKKSVEQARAEAERLTAARVDTEHFLLALLKDKKSVSAQILAAFGVDYPRVLARLQG
jgi:ATP-dependent Clp protease ATP-binding subunit ClpC